MADEVTKTETTEVKETAEDVLRRDLDALAAAPPAPQASENQPGEAKPPETKAEPEVKAENKSTEQETTEEEAQSSKEFKPTKDNWKAERESRKKVENELKAARAELDAFKARSNTADALPHTNEATRPDPDKQVSQPQAAATEKRFDPEFVFRTLARANAGELTDAHKREAEAYITEKMTPAELRNFMTMARRGHFGDMSAEFLDLARSYSPEVLANHEINKEQRARQEQAEQIRVQTWGAVLQALPDLNVRESETFKSFQAASVDLARAFPDLWTKPEAPQIVAEYLSLKRDATAAKTLSDQVKALTAENEQLKKRMGVSQAPQATRQAGGSTGTARTAEQELAEGLAAAGVLQK